MLESSGDLGLSDESHASVRVVCGLILDSLECDIAIQLLVVGDVDHARRLPRRGTAECGIVHRTVRPPPACEFVCVARVDGAAGA